MSKANFRKRKIFAVISILVVLAAIEILVDPLSFALTSLENIEARIRIPAQRAQWDAQRITHYSFDVQIYVPLVCISGGNIEVMDDKVIRIGERSDSALTMGFTQHETYFLCDYRNYTMSQLFDEAEGALLSSITGITFDPDYGFISSLGFGYGSGHGLLEPRVSDCCGGFRIENFRVLEQEVEP